MYLVGMMGQNMIYNIIGTGLYFYFQSVIFIPAMAISIFMAVARVWDAINDPIMGYIMDHANPKNGKMKPYLIYTPIPIAILTVLLFYAPNISDTAKMIYAAITYVAWV